MTRVVYLGLLTRHKFRSAQVLQTIMTYALWCDCLISVIQVLTVSSAVPPKVSAALSAAEEARCSLDDLQQRERLISNMLHQVQTPPVKIHQMFIWINTEESVCVAFNARSQILLNLFNPWYVQQESLSNVFMMVESCYHLHHSRRFKQPSW